MPFRQSGYIARYALLRNFKQVDHGGYSKGRPVFLRHFTHTQFPHWSGELAILSTNLLSASVRHRHNTNITTITTTHKGNYGPFPPLANKAILKPT